MLQDGLGEVLERLYRRYNRREYVSPDPLQFLYNYDDLLDREIVGLIASSLAYGNVKQIIRSVEDVLRRIGGEPRRYLVLAKGQEIRKDLHGFKHRFTDGSHMAEMLLAIKEVIMEYGSIYNGFLSLVKDEDPNILPALTRFVDLLDKKRRLLFLIPSPDDKSPCKRLNLFLRWMVRKDEVDPGGWCEISPSKLIYPVDTHMHKIALSLGITRRKNPSLGCAVEITRAFSKFSPHDPVKYDFVLTRFGIRGEQSIWSELKNWFVRHELP